ncbi:surface-adhesin E family protein [Acinetobacter haemolyticus]|uniref:surface-adhesin E family protein n=1 Tax=Acinetobacter haemolyticus TaxID=29430 RepID=UPI000D68C937|nr:surface-adhesin E family protein [Acinetobacter haemolyticus]
MKKIFLLCGLLTSSISFGADWKYAAIGAQNDRAIYVDSSQYIYDKKNNTVKAWFKTVSYKDLEGSETYTKSKNLYQFSCLDNKIKLLAYVNYSKDGSVISSGSQESKSVKFDFVIPDTIGESMWRVACLTKGGGFRYPKYQLGERLSKAETEKIFPKGHESEKFTQEEIDEFYKNLTAN